MAFALQSQPNKMLPGFFLLFFLCESTVKSQTTTHAQTTHTAYTTATVLQTLQVVATPDYPVAAGQTISLYCSVNMSSQSVTWFLQRLDNQTWTDVSRGEAVTLTQPWESGLYRCYAENHMVTSTNHRVYIVAMLPTVGENLGIAAFVFSLLALSISLIVVFCLWRQRFSVTLPPTATKGFAGPDMEPKGDLPQAEDDGNVYMNYTSRNQAYADLDPTRMTVDDAYSALS